MDADELKNRTKRFALRILKLAAALPRTIEGNIIRGQLVRAGTSVGANYRAACRGRSRAEFAAKVGVGFTYLSKIENRKLDQGHGPSEKLIRKLAIELDGNEQELLLLAEKVPEPVRKRVIERPHIFVALAQLDDADLDAVFQHVAAMPKKRRS